MGKQIYDRSGVLPIKQVMPYIEKHFHDQGKFRIYIGEHFVKVLSLRMRTFLKKGTICPCCNLAAKHFAVERTNGTSEEYHLNLYGISAEGEEVIFTHDHILARARGGLDNLENARTMCGPCNWSKGELERQLLKNPSNDEIVRIEEELKKYLP